MKPVNKAAPWLPTPFENKHAHALRALQRGECAPHQQTLVLDFIIKELCRTYDLSYRPESQRDTDFAEGKRYIGLQIVRMLNAPLAVSKEASKPNQES